MGSIAIVGAGGVATGDIAAPLLEADTILIADERITAIGKGIPFNPEDFEVVLDARGCLAAPGLIDSHVHLVLGDYTPRQQTVGFLESYVHGGITRCMSASEVHAPGRPSDPEGVKALALAAHRCFERIRPGGMTVHGGSLILEPGLQAEDFAYLAGQGVWQAKAGMGDFHPAANAAPYVRLAQRHGMKVMCHTGGVSIPGSSPVSVKDLLEMMPDVSGHVNGGTTSLPLKDLPTVVDSGIALQICQAGNLRSALEVIRLAAARDALARVLIASDTPTGTGMMPLGVIKSVVELSSLSPLPPEVAICMATGNVGRVYGVEAGILQPGWAGDVILIDAPLGSSAEDALSAISIGDIPGIGAVITSGVLRVLRSRNTAPATRMPAVLEERLSVWRVPAPAAGSR